MTCSRAESLIAKFKAFVTFVTFVTIPGVRGNLESFAFACLFVTFFRKNDPGFSLNSAFSVKAQTVKLSVKHSYVYQQGANPLCKFLVAQSQGLDSRHKLVAKLVVIGQTPNKRRPVAANTSKSAFCQRNRSSAQHGRCPTPDLTISQTTTGARPLSLGGASPAGAAATCEEAAGAACRAVPGSGSRGAGRCTVTGRRAAAAGARA